MSNPVTSCFERTFACMSSSIPVPSSCSSRILSKLLLLHLFCSMWRGEFCHRFWFFKLSWQETQSWLFVLQVQSTLGSQSVLCTCFLVHVVQSKGCSIFWNLTRKAVREQEYHLWWRDSLISWLFWRTVGLWFEKTLHHWKRLKSKTVDQETDH